MSPDIERYMEECIVTLRKDGVQEHEIGAYGLAYIVAVMDRMVEVGEDLDQEKASRYGPGPFTRKKFI